MSALFRDDGTRVGPGDVDTTTETVTYVTLNEPLNERSHYGSFDHDPAGDKLTNRFKVGDRLTQAQYDALFPQATIDSITPATGAAVGGTEVTITGSGFDGVTGVTFGGTAAAAFEVVSSTEATATTPAHAAGAVDVTVTDEAGAVTETGGFTYA